MSETIEVIKSRHSVRSYLPDAIDAEQIKAVVEAGTVAPHSLTLKSLKFTVIADPAKLDLVNTAIRNSFRNIPITDDMNPRFQALLQNAKDDDESTFIYGAPVFVIVSTNADNAYAEIDTALAIENILLAATSLGLGACWMNQLAQLKQAPPVKGLLQELGIPETNEVFGTVIFGKPAGKDKPMPRREPEIDYYL